MVAYQVKMVIIIGSSESTFVLLALAAGPVDFLVGLYTG